MDLDAVVETLKFNPVEVFRSAVRNEFFGAYIFKTTDEDYYSFTIDETGNAVWIIKGDSDEQPYKVLPVEESRKFHPNPVIPRRVSIHHCAHIVDTWIEDRQITRIENAVKDGGNKFAATVNKAYIDVLMASATDESRINAESRRMDQILAQLFSRMAKSGFRLDTLIIAEHLHALLVQQQIIVPSTEIQNRHYVGKTTAGQRVFWSSEMPHNTAIVVASQIGITLMGDLNVRLVRHTLPLHGPTPAVCGYLKLNPIVKNRESVIIIEDIEEGFNGTTSGTGETAQIEIDSMYVNPDRLKELRALSPLGFDLRKLIRLCEELNFCYSNGCYLATAMLTRAVLDHVPPIFSFKTFTEVVNNYRAAGKSFKAQMQHLENSSRHIADRYLHTAIRPSEGLPNQTQVNFRNDLDALLEEIIRILK